MNRLIRRLCAAILAALTLFSLCGCKGIFSFGDTETVEEATPDPIGALSWASEGVTVTENPEELARRVGELYAAAADEGVGVEYKNEAFSLDGQNFDCYIGNPGSSHFPLFITIYADTTYQEELFVSGLIAPGQAFSRVTLSRPMEEPVSVLPVCYTQVYEPHTGPNDTDDFTIRAQAVLTINFNIVDR